MTRQLPMRHYCTYFDCNYLVRGLVLHDSLQKHSDGDFRLYILCLDSITHQILRSLNKPTIVPIPLWKIESWEPELMVAKQNRSLVEYWFTLSPVLPLYILKNFDCDLVTYLDADLMFFSSPEIIFRELGNKSIFVTEHRYSARFLNKGISKYGRFNVQCQSFRKSNAGISCLNRWKDQCIKWCYDRVDKNRYADQKYLDAWPDLYGDELVISKSPGIGLAPWNIHDSGLVYRDKRWIVRECPLVFYHFAGFHIISEHWLISGVASGWSIRKYAPLFCEYACALQKTYMTLLESDRRQAWLYGGTRYSSDRWKRIAVGLIHGNMFHISLRDC